MSQLLYVNGQRLWDSLMEMARIGATAKGGCNRQTLTDLDKQARDLYIKWAEEADCSIRIDTMGNIFARRSGKNNQLPVVMTGSHIDTQPTGGKFDGVYGVLAGLEVIRSLNDHDTQTIAPIEASIWTNEEGVRFSPAMIGSGVWSGEFDLEYGHNRRDKQGDTIKAELERIGFLGEVSCEPHAVKAFFEVHIEQGPILEDEGLQIGVLNGVQGMNWYDLVITGQPVHAGPTPMESRRDPFMGLHKIIHRLYSMIAEFAPWSRVTFGDIKALPGSRNTVPEQLVMAVDLRHPDQSILDEMERRFRDIAKQECEKLNLASEINDEWRSPAVKFDENCIESVRQSTNALGYSYKEMFSGAGHDSVYVSRVAPTSMIFIPCEKGISHNEAEYARPEDIEAGCNVLINAMLEQANRNASP
jgi:N-carbamoyl-L-amino-acid hydrolase